MKKITLILVAFLLFFTLNFTIANNANAYTRIRGYIKKSGTYVSPHYRTAPDRTKFNNWSTRGNSNPITGKKGYKSPIKTYKIKFR